MLVDFFLTIQTGVSYHNYFIIFFLGFLYTGKILFGKTSVFSKLFWVEEKVELFCLLDHHRHCHSCRAKSVTCQYETYHD